MTAKELPFSKTDIEILKEKYPTPFYVYDEEGIRKSAKELSSAFSWMPGFKNFFAVKALPNPKILEILKEEGMGADCSSLPELILAQKAGISGENIMFSSNDTPAIEYSEAYKMGAIINLDDVTHIPFIEKIIKTPEIICFRYNPGPLKTGNELIGKPEEAKYGCTREQLFTAYTIMKQKGVKRFGLHTMVASNELNADYFIETAAILIRLAADITKETGITFDFINLGGGIGIPYKPDQNKVDLNYISQGIRKVYEEAFGDSRSTKIYMECGRVVTGPHGYLITTAIHEKHTYRDYIGVDACMANLMRPGMYGAYHHITVLGKEKLAKDHTYDVSGSLCENNDKFAIQRNLPGITSGDIIAIHDAGAHGHAMGFNYNGKLRSAEFVRTLSGKFVQIRRAETIEDYFSTLSGF